MGDPAPLRSHTDHGVAKPHPGFGLGQMCSAWRPPQHFAGDLNYVWTWGKQECINPHSPAGSSTRVPECHTFCPSSLEFQVTSVLNTSVKSPSIPKWRHITISTHVMASQLIFLWLLKWFHFSFQIQVGKASSQVILNSCSWYALTKLLMW